MKLLSHLSCLCLVLALAWAETDDAHAHDHLDRCHGIEMDAAAVDEEEIPYFFKGDHLFTGFHSKAELFNESYPELDDHHHLCHVDAAFSMHVDQGSNHDKSSHHDLMFFFMDDKVFSYHKHKLEDGYPKNISEVFHGIPDHLDAAVLCHKPDCDEDSVIFFKGHHMYYYNVETKAVEEKEFASMPNCTSAFHFMGHYYCFHGHMFSKFNPKTGEVHENHPKETRDYFVRCEKFGSHSNDVERERCSHVHLDAVTSDHPGNMFAFRDHHFIHKDAGNDTLMVDIIDHAFKEVHSDVDAVFSYDDHLHMIQDDHVFVYTSGDTHSLLDGYPKSLKEELGIEGHVDAAFMCEDNHTAHIVKGEHIYDVDLNASPRVVSQVHTISLFKKVDAAMCDEDGIRVIVGNHFYHFDSLKLFVAGRALPKQHRVSMELFGCDH